MTDTHTSTRAPTPTDQPTTRSTDARVHHTHAHRRHVPATYMSESLTCSSSSVRMNSCRWCGGMFWMGFIVALSRVCGWRPLDASVYVMGVE